jgi:hypothetical protein
MASTRYAAGSVDIGRLSRTAVLVGGAAVVVWAWTWMRGPGRSVPWPMLLVGVGMVCWFLVRAVLRRHELRALVVDDRGVQIGQAVVAWHDVQEVAVLRHGPQGTSGGESPEVGVALRADAGLPSGLTALVRDPDPDAIPAQLRLSTAGWRLDVDRLGAAVRAHGGGVPLVERWGSARRVLA